jgi:hypothetical protein
MKLQLMMLAAAASFALAGCGGDDYDPKAAADAAAIAANKVPPSATDSVAAYTAYVESLPKSETAVPVDVSAVTPPTSETAAPLPL